MARKTASFSLKTTRNCFGLVILIGVLFSSVMAQSVYYSENFEGTSSMTVTGGGWEFGTPTVTPNTVPEGTKCAGTILNGSYANNANYQMVTPSITLPNVDTIRLMYTDWYQLESCCDRIILEIEQNASGVWNQLFSTGSSNTVWTQEKYSLSTYRNSSIRLRFTLTSDVSVVNPGWYVDNIKIYHPVQCSLTVNAGTGGTSVPTGLIPVDTGIAQTITATPTLGYRFANWTITSGSPTIANSSNYSTTATLHSNATVQANFTPGQINTISGSDVSYNFTTNYYTGVDPSGGVAFSFTPSTSGSYAITIGDPSLASYKYLYYYGTGSTFSSIAGSQYGSGVLTYAFTAVGGTTYYFKVVPNGSSYWTNNFTIRQSSTPTLTMSSSGSGTTSPTGSTPVVSGVPQSIVASPSTGNRFNGWTVTSGSASIAGPSSYSTTATLTSNATIQANFSAGTIYGITGSDATYNFTTNFYTGYDPTGGVAFSCAIPGAGSYAITVSDVSISSTKYLYCYGTNSSFSSLLGSQYGSGTITYLFTTTTAATYYFKVVPYSSSYWSNNFTIRQSSTPTLTMSSSGSGTTSPTGSTPVVSGVPQSIVASPSTGYRFVNWTVAGGSASIAGPSSYSTTATLTSNATIQANFSAGTIYTVTGSDATYNFTTNYYSGYDPSGGVAFSYYAASSGSCAIVVSDVSASYKYLYSYGTSSTFSSALASQYGAGTLTCAFSATAGQTYYFKIVPANSAYWPNNFSIRQNSTPTLTVTNNGNGTTTPSGATAVVSGVAQTITASSNAGYRFNNWIVTNGNATIASPTSYSTTATVSADATVQATFNPGIIHTVTGFDSTYNFTTHYYSGNDPSTGVALSITLPAAGTYAIVVTDVSTTSYKYLYNYGTSSTFSSTVDYRYGTGTLTYLLTVAAPATYYFKVIADGSSYWSNNFSVHQAVAPTLSMTNDGHGSTSPTGSTIVAPGVAQTITATSNSGYRFNNWSVVSGSATIANPSLYSTTVILNANATIQANFTTGIVHQITGTDSAYNFTTHYYTGNDPSGGVAFSVTVPAAGSYALVISDVSATSTKYLFNYGTNSTFASYSGYTYGSGTMTYIFTTTAATTYYFIVSPYSSSYWSNSFTIRQTPAPTLSVLNDGHGTTSPTGNTAVVAGVAQSISATPSIGYKFNNWTIPSGSATIANSTSYSTTVTLNGNATIQANFSAGVINAITASDVSYNFTSNYYSGVDPSGGAAFSFTAPSTGSYAVVVSDGALSSTKYLYYYGTSTGFGSYLDYRYGAGTLTFPLSATAGVTYYFKVIPTSSSYWSNNFSIRYMTIPTLVVSNDGHGTTTPSGNTAMISGVSQTITATPNAGYRFNNWTVTNGTATIVSPTSYSTSASITADAAIQANFTAGTINPISSTDITYNFTTNYYAGISPSGGVAFSFTAPASGSYAFVVSDVSAGSYKYLYYYGTNSAFSGTPVSQYGSGTLTYMISATAGITYYFMVVPLSSSYWSNNFAIHYATTPTLTVINNGYGTTTPKGSNPEIPNATVSITATPKNPIYYFSRWELVSGSATIANTTSSATTVTMATGDATIRAVFNSYPHDTLIIARSSYGFTVPKDTVFILSGHDTSVTASANGGYLFTSWSLTQGSATIATPNNVSTRVAVSGGVKAKITPNYILNPLTKPRTRIVDVNISGHPDICITASVTDTAGRSITGLDSSEFTVTQDGATVPFQLTSITNVQATSVTLLIDNSGSMQPQPLIDACNSAKEYVKTMDIFDRCAIVSFGGASYDSGAVYQSMTNDTTLLNYALSHIPNGSGTPLLEATFPAIAQLIPETNSKAVILFTDGVCNTPSLKDSLIRYARQNGVALYCIGIGSGVDSVLLKSLADSTGGYYSYAPAAGDLARIYAQIKHDVEAQYILCYRSPDVVFNGDTHTVVVSTTLNSRTSRDTAHWNENNHPPVITLTPATAAKLGVNQTASIPLTIQASVTDDGSVSGVRLFYRRSNSSVGAYTEIPMTLTSGTVYQAVIPASDVYYPGIDFYILATDNYHLIGRSPNILSPDLQPWVIPVGNEAPLIVATSPACTPIGTAVPITATITDGDGVRKAILYYKKSNDAFYNVDTMAIIAANTYRSTIGAAYITAGGAGYYIRAIDNVGVSGRSPQSGETAVLICSNHAPSANAGPDLSANVGSGCNATVSLAGSGTDADGDALTYSWTGPFAGTLSGANQTVTLPVGRYNAILTVTDSRGGIGRDTAIVSIVDNTPPQVPTLPAIKAQCSVTLSPPTTTDNCLATIVGTTADPLTYNSQGNFTVHWAFTDASGNTVSQVQSVTIKDTIAPVPSLSALPTIQGSCAVNLSRPTATDNCAGLITGSTTDPISYSAQGNYTVHWKYDDNHGNVSTQDQNVIVRDVTPPRITRGKDTTVIIAAANSNSFVTLTSATAYDSCSASSIGASRDDGLSLDSAYRVGITNVKWKACDNNGNCDSGIQKVTVVQNRIPQITAVSDTTIKEKDVLRLPISASDPDGNALHISAANVLPAGASIVDSGNGKAILLWNTGCNDHGAYSIKAKVFDGMDSAITQINLTVTDVDFPPVLTKTNDTTAWFQMPLFITVHSEDCDNGPAPKVRAINLPPGAQFRDNGDGTGTLIWTPQEKDAGYYMVIFEAKDDMTAVRDTIIITVQDPKQFFAPTLIVSARDTSVGINLPLIVLARSTVQDGTVPVLSATSLLKGASFVNDNAGNGLFSWTPHDSGTFTFIITASNITNSAWQTSDTVSVKVENKNVTGPKFLPHSDTVIYQNTDLALTVEAKDPDGTIPELFAVNAPSGVRFVDNGNGTGTFYWRPKCDAFGRLTLRAGATDHFLSDTISVGIDVRAVNFPPILSPIPDKSAALGDMVRIPVTATDPCNGTIPMLSVSCELPGYTFKVNNDGTGEFGWQVTYDTGSYPITFYATNGYATASRTVILSVNKFGTVIVKVQPSTARIYGMPSMNFPGTFLGTDSVRYTARPGTYWFEVAANGFRSQRMAYEIKADSIYSHVVTLKPAIPLMFTVPDSFTVDTAVSSATAGQFTFADVNGDGRQDLSVISQTGFKTCFGFNTGSDSGFVSRANDSAEVRTPLVNPVGHVFTDWYTSGGYSCIASLSNGKIVLLKPDQGRYAVAETLCAVTGNKPYPLVMDVNRDGKKDLVIHSEGIGIFVYPNIGSDSLPILGTPHEITDSLGNSLKQFKGPPMLIDMDQTGSYAWIMSYGGYLRSFSTDSSCSTMKYVSDLNCAGARCPTDSARYALLGSPFGQPKLAIVKGNLLRIFSTHLCGDVNGDGTVDIRDIGRISKLWEVTDRDASWIPLYNLKISDGTREVIDIRDIGRASKCWELKE